MPPRRITPNTNITTKELLGTESLADYLRLKLQQLGTTCSRTGIAMGYTDGEITRRIVNSDPGTNGFISERLVRLANFFVQKHEALNLGPYTTEERRHLVAMNHAMPRAPLNTMGKRRYRGALANPSIKEEALLATQHLGAYLELKRDQLGLSRNVMDDTLGYRNTYEKLRSGERTGQFAPEIFDLLVKKLKPPPRMSKE